MNQPAARVAVVVSHLGLGGAERQTVELLRQLRGTAWAPLRVICLSGDVNPYAATVRELGYPLSIVRRTQGFDVSRWRQLRRLLQEDEIDIVHAVNWFASAYAILAKPRRAKVVSSIRNSYLPAGLVRRCTMPALLRRSAGVLVNSDRGRELLVHTCRIPAARINVVPNGIDVRRLRTAGSPGRLRRELNIPAEAPLVAYLGRNARVKNIPRLIRVVDRLLSSHEHAHVVLAGEGLGPSVIQGTGIATAPRVHCLGPRRDVPSILCDATLLLLTSDSEGMPNVVLEALAAGVPVVATAVGDVPRIVPAECGALVETDDEQLASAVLRVVAHAAAYRQSVERHGPHIARTYSLGAMARRTVDVWRTAGALSG